MRLDDFNRSINDVLTDCVRSMTISHGITVFPTMDLAKAWLENSDERWLARERHKPLPEGTPKALVERGLKPFDTGSFMFSENDTRLSIIEGHPPFYSPASGRDHAAAATVFAGFGELGAQKYTAYHEIGHYVEQELGMLSKNDKGRLESECRADGFSIALAVSKGQDPVQCVRDVGAFRACNAIRSVDAEYFTLPFLTTAAEIGMEARAKRMTPADMMERLDQRVQRDVNWFSLVEQFQGQPFDTIRGHSDDRVAKTILQPMHHYLQHQPSWTQQQEALWWSRLLASNPDQAPVLKRMTPAMMLDQYSQPHFLEAMQEGAPIRVESLLRALKPVLGTGTTDALMPTKDTTDAHVGALRKAGHALQDPLDLRMKMAVDSIAQAMERCPDPMLPLPKSRTQPALPEPVGSMLLVDMRTATIDLPQLHQALSRHRVQAIGVVGPSCNDAEAMAKTLRCQGDCLAASIHPMDTERLTARMDRIQPDVKAGKIWMVGDLPELRVQSRAPMER